MPWIKTVHTLEYSKIRAFRAVANLQMKKEYCLFKYDFLYIK